MSPMQPPIRTCDRISEQIHLLVDKELGPAETAVVEKHLHECARCQIVAARLERMSSVLKQWDVECNDHDAPALRLQNAVLARVAEQGAVRRRENRMDNLVQFATAACVLIAIGLAVVLGLQPGDEAPERVVTVKTRPAPLASVPSHAGTVLTDAAIAKGLDALEGYDPIAPVDTPLRRPLRVKQLTSDGSAEHLAVIVERMRRVEELTEQLGTQVMACYLPSFDGQLARTLPVKTYRYLYERGLIREWTLSVQQRGSRTVESGRTSPEPTARETGKVAREMLEPMPGLRGTKIGSLFERPAMQLPVNVRARRVRDAKPAVSPLASTPLDPNPAAGSRDQGFLDPVVAQSQARKQLTLKEGKDAGSVIALVEGTTQPIFIPAGQLLTGGKADRVVAQPVWLPPAAATTPYVIPCRVVEQYPDGNGEEEPMIQPWIAGPTIRALLAAGASQAEVKEAARLQVEAFVSKQKKRYLGDNWSLAHIYGHHTSKTNMASLTRGYRVRKDDAGFVVTDNQDRVLGVEIVRLKGPAAEALLHRLWFSYALEGILRVRGTSTQAVAAPSEGIREAMRVIVNHNGSFRMPTGFTQIDRTRVSSVEVEAAGLHIHALEAYGKPTVVSALSSPTR